MRHYCRLVVEHELDDQDVIEYFDIVQSIVPTKLVTAYTESDSKVSITVTAYTGEDDKYIYEILLGDSISLDEGEAISDTVAEEFDFNFDLETSLEI